MNSIIIKLIVLFSFISTIGHTQDIDFDKIFQNHLSIPYKNPPEKIIKRRNKFSFYIIRRAFFIYLKK